MRKVGLIAIVLTILLVIVGFIFSIFDGFEKEKEIVVSTTPDKMTVETTTETIAETTTVVESDTTSNTTIDTTVETTNDAWPYGEIVNENNTPEFKMSIVDYEQKYRMYSPMNFDIGCRFMPVPSSSKCEKNFVEQVFSKEQMSQQIKTYCDILEWDFDETVFTKKEFKTVTPDGTSIYCSMSDDTLYYFFLGSPEFLTEYTLDDGDIFYDNRTKTAYIYLEQSQFSKKYDEILMSPNVKNHKFNGVYAWACVDIEKDVDVEEIKFILPEKE
jgi:hypothetical protein